MIILGDIHNYKDLAGRLSELWLAEFSGCQVKWFE